MTRDCPGCTKRWMDMAACLPAAIASMANLGPVWQSPPVKTSGCPLWKVNSSARSVPLGLNSADLYEKLENIKAQKNAKDTLVAGFEFHHELAVLSGNTLLPFIFRSYYLAVIDIWVRFYELNGADLIYQNSHHIWEALKARNLQAALQWIDGFTYEITEGKYTIYF